MPPELATAIAQGSIGQEFTSGASGKLTFPATKRGRGRPAGSKTQGEDAREGKSSGRHPEPDMVERLRMAALDAIAARMPIAFRFLDDRTLDKIEEDLDRRLSTELSKERLSD